MHKWVIEPTIYGLPHGHYEGDLYTDYAPTVKSSAYAANNPLIEKFMTINGEEFGCKYFYKKGRVHHLRKHMGQPSMMAAYDKVKNLPGIRIRRLTERELYRLMDVEETDIDTLLNAPIPRTQHAKLAGNSIVVACLYHIFRTLFIDTEPTPNTQTSLF